MKMEVAPVKKVIKILSKKYKIKFRKEDPFRVLISVLLSHRTKDETSWSAAERLFRKAKNLDEMFKLKEKEIAKIIYPVGFYNQKAKRIKTICKILKEKYKGKVPKDREKLIELPGVGGKSADIVLSHSYGQPVIACDAHVIWVSNQLRWTTSKNPEKVRDDLHKIVPIRYRLIVNGLFVQFGKDICITGRPKCYLCPIKTYCPSSELKLNQF